MALAMLCHEAGLDITILHFDHNLRAESAQEAAWLAEHFKALGIPFYSETWVFDAKPDQGRLQAEARDARYTFFKRKCAELGISDVLLGHSVDDVAETFLMRLFYGSGLQGLKPMQATTQLEGGLTLHRPLIQVKRQDLRDYLKAQNCPWLEDPSNANADFVRVRARYWLSRLGVTTDLIGLSEKFEKLDVTLEPLEQNLILKQSKTEALLDRELLQKPAFLQARVVKAIVKDLTGNYPPRTKQIEGLLAHLNTSQKPRELGHLRWQCTNDGVYVQTTQVK